MSDYLKNLEKYNLLEPTAISKKSFEEIKQDIVKDIESKNSIKLIESDDFMPVVETFAYREQYLRNLINEIIKKMLPHYSSGDDLDNFIFAFFGGMLRLENEEDMAFLERARLSLNSYSSAGSDKSYIFWTKNFDKNIYDVKPLKKEDAVVQIIYASRKHIDENRLLKYLSGEKVRPLTDKVEILKAINKKINLEATIIVFDEKDIEQIKDICLKNFEKHFFIGEKVVFSKLIDLLHINGVYSVNTNIKNDIEIAENEVAKIELNLTIKGRNV